MCSNMQGQHFLIILHVGMTNRKDMIDEALLRPGRLEVQMEISLPDEHGRVQILNIHTSQIKENDKLGGFESWSYTSAIKNQLCKKKYPVD